MDIYCNTGKFGWSTYYDAFFLKKYIKRFNFKLKSVHEPPINKDSIVLFTDPGAFCSVAKDYSKHRNVIVCWWHGDAQTNNLGVKKRIPIAKKYLNNSRSIVVSCDQGLDSVKSMGIDMCKIHKIPLGVDMPTFVPMEKQNMRQKYGIPHDVFCVGSFQRDTDKIGGGKWIKGPDIIAKSIYMASKTIKNVFVLLSGPRRSYISKKLSKYKINFKHVQIDSFFDMPQLYSCLDCYLIGSRVEGGPKSLMESLSCEVPVVSTNCGMAKDVIKQGFNGYLANIDDVETLSKSLVMVSEGNIEKKVLRDSVVEFDYRTSVCNKYERLFV